MTDALRGWLSRRPTRLLHWAPLGLILLAVAGAFVVRWLQTRPEPPAVVGYSALLTQLDQRSVASLTIVPGDEIRGTWARGAEGHAAGSAFSVDYPTTEVSPLLARAERAGTPVTLESPARGASGPWWNLGIMALVLTAIGLIARHQVRSATGGGGETDLGVASRSRTTFADVAGQEGTVSELRELVQFLKTPAAFLAVGARTPRGVLMSGPPGTGKTLMARAIAGEAGVPFYAISGSEVTGFLIGLGAARLKRLFAKARSQGGVIFIDEIDALGGRRGRNRSHNEDDRSLNQLLVEMDGFTAREHVLVIGATNRTEDLDPALTRPGRFDRAVHVGLPTTAEREAILRLHVRLRGVPLAEDVDLAWLARLMPQTSGAELANLVNESAIAAAREEARTVTWRHVELARDRLLLGKERTGFTATEDEWATVAVHEAGHAIAGLLFHPEDGLHKVTIQPRGQAMGVAHFAPGEQVMHTRRALEGQICKGLGGRAAEAIVFGDDAVTSGAKADLQHTSRVAREMVYKLGMGPTTGLVAFDERAPAGAMSGELHAAMDRDVQALVEELYGRVTKGLSRHRPALEALAAALREHETLDGEAVIAICASHGVPVSAVAPRRPTAPTPVAM
jgi:cell division protease FtsH